MNRTASNDAHVHSFADLVLRSDPDLRIARFDLAPDLDLAHIVISDKPTQVLPQPARRPERRARPGEPGLLGLPHLQGGAPQRPRPLSRRAKADGALPRHLNPNAGSYNQLLLILNSLMTLNTTEG